MRLLVAKPVLWASGRRRVLGQAGLATSFRQELDDAWTVRLGPLARDYMRAILDQFAW